MRSLLLIVGMLIPCSMALTWPRWLKNVLRSSRAFGTNDAIECELSDTILKPEPADTACKGKGQDNDPHTVLLKLLAEHLEEKGSEIVVLSRPVSDSARSYMCRLQAVGKGFDIKPKSSKLKQPVSGFVPACQCGDAKMDLSIAGTDGAPSSCENLYGKLGGDTDMECFITQRVKSNTMQTYSNAALTDLTAGKPSTVTSRACILFPVNSSGGKSVLAPFFGYKWTDDSSKNTHISPIVSDYDVLFLAEAPRSGAEEFDRYPLLNEDGDYFKKDNFPELVRLTLEKHCGNKNAVGLVEKQVQALITRLDNTGIGLSSKGVNGWLTGMIAKFAQTTGAFRHGAENENYAAPQPFEDATYPLFKGGNAVPMYASDEEKGAVGEEGVQKLYLDLLGEGYCVPINFHWLAPPYEQSSWKEVWEAGQKVKGCQFYTNAHIVAHVDKFFECMRT